MRTLLGRIAETLLAAYLVFSLVVPARLMGVGVVGEAEAQISPAPSQLLPGFGSASATPRMLIIMDTSRSMRFYPDNTGQSNVDFSPTTGAATTNTYNDGEGNVIHVNCPIGRISSVVAAYYGRTSDNNLSSIAAPPWHPTDDTSGCNVGASTPQGGTVRGWLDISNVVQTQCINQATCNISVDNTSLQGDPCNGKHKDAWVQVTCDVDPCPAGSGSKFCLAKKAMYAAVKTQQSTGLLEIAGGGYSQFDYYQYHDPVTSNYDTKCRYDVVLKANGYTSPLAGWTTTELNGSTRAGSPSNGSDTNYVTFSCNPESGAEGATFASYLSVGNGNIYNAGGAATGCAAQSSKTCYKYWNRTGVSQYRFQNPNAACKASAPSGGNPWTWAGGCQPADLSPDQKFANHGFAYGFPASDWWLTDLQVPATTFTGGSCANAPSWYTDVTTLTSGSSVGGSPPAGSALPAGSSSWTNLVYCGDTTGAIQGPCAFALASPTGSSQTVRSINVFNTSYGVASVSTPVTIAGQTYNQGYTAQPNQTVVLPASMFAGVCPAPAPAYTFTGTLPSTVAWSNSATPPYNGTFNVSSFNGAASTWEDCSVGLNGALGCQLTSASTTPTTLYTCPATYTANMATPTTNPGLTCTQTRYMHETSGVTGAAANPGVYSAWAGSGIGSWQPFTYTVDLVTYGVALAGGTDLCGSATPVTWTTSSYPAAGAGINQATGLPCGTSNDPANGGTSPTGASSSKCNIKLTAATELRTDQGIAVCHSSYYAEAYSRTANPGVASACSFSVTPYRYDFTQDVCTYKRFLYEWDQVQFGYRWASNLGDYGGAFDQSVAYPNNVPAAKQYCGGVEARVPNADVNEPYAESGTSNTGGFSYTYSPFVIPLPEQACPAQLAAGTGSCPSTAAYCKLRWSSDNMPGSRFEKMQPAPGMFSLGSTPSYLDVGHTDRLGCAVGDPLPHSSYARSVLGSWTDWCRTNTQKPYAAGWYDGDTPPPGQTAQAPRRMADFYTPNGAFSNSNRNTWPALWGSGGTNNPFAAGSGHMNPSLDRFCAVSEDGDAGVCTTTFPAAPFPASKASGLSLEPTTLAGGTTSAVGGDFDMGMAFSRWRRAKACSVPADCSSIAGSTCSGSVCTDPTWVDHSVDLFSKYDFTTNPWGLRMPDEGDITPLAGSLTNALAYINKTRAEDSQATCRRYSVMLVTDGFEEPASFGGVANDPVAAVTALKNAGVDVYVVGFGVQGGVLDQMAQAAGTAVDPVTGNQSATGGAYNASNFAALQAAITSIIGSQLSGFFSRSKPTLTTSGDRLYSAYFGLDSSKPLEYLGFVDAFSVSSGAVSPTPTWKFDQVLNTVTTPGSRTMYTRIRGVSHLDDFDVHPNCTLVQDMCSDASGCSGGCATSDKNYVDDMINFVRNDRSGASAGKYVDSSIRQTRVADIFYSQPVPVPAPSQSPLWASLSAIAHPNNDNFPRTDSSASPGFDMVKFNHAYDRFKTLNAGREMQVFVHSNDGVLHSIRESMASTPPSWLGEEKWGYVARQTQPLLYKRMGGHRFLADGSFAVADVCFGKSDCEKDTGSSKWLSLLVGSLGRGGPYLYGMDITDPSSPEWLWDVNPDSTNYPSNLTEDGIGLATSSPVVARVMVDTDPYKWGVFVGGGYWDNSRDAFSNNNCSDDSIPFLYNEHENGNYFYVFDADPANRWNNSALPMHQTSPSKDARWCIKGVNYQGLGFTVPPNSVPGRPGVLRQNNNSRASTVYFGDTDGKINRMDVTSRNMAAGGVTGNGWKPYIWFNPYNNNTYSLGPSHFTHMGSAGDSSIDPGANCTLTSGNVWPMPNITGAPPNRSIPLAKPSSSDGLAPIWQRPYRYTNQNSSRDVLYVGTGDPMNPNASTTNRKNYFYAVEDQTDVSTTCPSLLRWAYYLEDGAKVLSDPAVVGNNIIVGVYVPPGGTGGCGSTGYSLLFCFDRLNGSPVYCLTNNVTPSPHDDPAPVGGRSRWLEVGSGMVSDLTALRDSVVFTTSINPGSPTQKSVQNVNVPFKVRSWRRLR